MNLTHSRAKHSMNLTHSRAKHSMTDKGQKSRGQNTKPCRELYQFDLEVKGQLHRIRIMNVRDTSSHGDRRMCQKLWAGHESLQTDEQTGRQTGGRADRRTDRRTDKQTDRQTYRQSDSYIPPNFVHGVYNYSATN